MAILGLFQLVVGSFLVLFAPGYAWTMILFRKGELDRLEQLVFSFALSIAMVPLAVLYLNKFLGVGINLWSVLLTVLVLTAMPLAAAQRTKSRWFDSLWGRK